MADAWMTSIKEQDWDLLTERSVRESNGTARMVCEPCSQAGTSMKKKEEAMAQPKFHEYMSEMGIEISHEYERNGVSYIVGHDLKGRRFVVPKGWLAKPWYKKLFFKS
jgi:hypothetical protein